MFAAVIRHAALGLVACAPAPLTTESLAPGGRGGAPRSARVLPQPTSRPAVRLRVASWNVRRLGEASTDLNQVADVIADFDLVAIQEVMTREVIATLDDKLPEHRALVTDTPRPQHAGYREYFAFFYRAVRADPVFATFVPDPHDRFVRDPYVACFAIADAQTPVCMVSVHVVWGDRVALRKQEILGLSEAVQWAQSSFDRAAWLVLGDFNRVVDDGDVDLEPEAEWQALLGQTLPHPLALAGSEIATTLGSRAYAHSYDHCFVSRSARVLDAGRIDIVRNLCEGDFMRCRKTLSDHAPVFVELELR